MEMNKKKESQQADFIVEMPVIVEERIKIDGKIINRKYERGKFLGKGGFAKCYEMKCVETKKIYAAKLFEKKALTNSKSRKKLINEIKLHKKLHHQNIVNFEHFFEDKENVYILLELCSNQTLNELLKRRKRLTDLEVQCYIIQIIKALKYIHNHKIIHRDLKLGNLFINNKLELKLGDFGLAAKIEYEGQKRHTVCGTPNYIAPEVLEKKNGHSYQVDIWSLGVIMYTLYYGKPPYETTDVKLTYKKIKVNDYTFPEPIKVNYNAKKLISSILNLDPTKRPNLDDILDHEYFKMFSSVPHRLNLCTLACPPKEEFVNKYIKNNNSKLSNQIASSMNNLLSSSYDNNNELIKFRSCSKENNLINKNKSINIDMPSHRKSGSCLEVVNDVNNNNNNTNNIANNNTSSYKISDLKDFKFKQLNEQVEENNIKDFINCLEKENEDYNSKNNILCSTACSKILKYFDFTNKFGYVYLVSNIYNYIGICFNDFSNIIMNITIKVINNKSKYCYSYFDRSNNNTYNFDDVSFENSISSNSLNKDLIKKLQTFKQIVIKYDKEISNLKNVYEELDVNSYTPSSISFIKDFMKSDQAIMFRLSNKLVQFIFIDKSELLMNTESNYFIFKNKAEEEIYDSIINGLSNDNNDIIKRIRYAKSMMIYFVKTYTNDKKKKI